MKFLIAALLVVASNAFAGDLEDIEVGKKNAVLLYKDQQDPQFRKLKIIRGTDGRSFALCGEIRGKNKADFMKFWAPFKLESNSSGRPNNFPDQIWNELVDAVCVTSS